MALKLKNNGFSLIEVMISAGILAIGFVFIAGTFPVGVKLTTMATETTIAAIVSDEAAVKIQAYFGPIDPANWGAVSLDPDETVYPSTPMGLQEKKYYWSFLYGTLDSGQVPVIVFVSRKAGAGARYPRSDPSLPTSDPDYGRPASTDGTRPTVVKVEVTEVDPRRLRIDSVLEKSCVVAGSTIVYWHWNATTMKWEEKKERVLERDPAADHEIIISEDWLGASPDFVWVVPPAVGGGRYPCVGIYDRSISSAF